MGWIYLLAAGLCEIFYAAAMPKTNGFTKLWPNLFCLLFSGSSMNPAVNFRCSARATVDEIPSI